MPGAISPRPSGGSSADGAPCVKEPCTESWANQPQVAVLDGGATLDPAWAVGRTHRSILFDQGGSSVLIGKGGNDHFVFDSTGRGAEDTAFGGHGDDVLDMSEAACPDVLTFHGGLGRDRYFDDSSCGNVTFLGERGNDSTVSFGTHFGSVVLDGGDGDDVLRGGDERTILRGGSGRDRLFGDLTPDGSSDRLRGGPGADSLHGMSGRDRLLGGTGIDENFGGQGSDLCRSPARGPRARSCER